MSEIKLRKREPIAAALRRLKKAMDVEGILKTVREKRFYEKPSRKKYRQRRKARFNTRLNSKREEY
jgi:small subunit ribosomal protein S21